MTWNGLCCMMFFEGILSALLSYVLIKRWEKNMVIRVAGSFVFAVGSMAALVSPVGLLVYWLLGRC